MSDAIGAQRAIKLREIELEILALEQGRVPYGMAYTEALPGNIKPHQSRGRAGALSGEGGDHERIKMDWRLAWENFDYALNVRVRRNAERFKAIGDAQAFLLLECLYRELGDVVTASSYVDRAWSITTSLGYSAYRDGTRCATHNPFSDDTLGRWFEFGWNQRAGTEL